MFKNFKQQQIAFSNYNLDNNKMLHIHEELSPLLEESESFPSVELINGINLEWYFILQN